MKRLSGSVAVLGAGSVGVGCALALQARGAAVTLVDRTGPAAEASYGNAGILPPDSCAPFNGPWLWRDLPGMLARPTAGLRVDWGHALRHAGWAARFLAANARAADFAATTAALDGLIRLSMAEHGRLAAEAGVAGAFRDSGWLHLHRSEAGFAQGAAERAALAARGVAFEALDRDGIAALEPHLGPAFRRAVFYPQARSCDDPGGAIRAYARLFATRGGRIERLEAAALTPEGGGWRVSAADGRSLTADRVVVALGAWSRELLARVGLRAPLLWERGYHMHYRAAGNATLSRPVLDAERGYVLAPMAQGIRLTTGVEIAPRDAPKSGAPLARAEAAVRDAFPLAERLEPEPWMGRRPTLPDSRPMIGPAPGRPGLWLAFGHQHIGWTTGPGTGALLAAMMADDAVPIPPEPFAPARYV